MYLYVGPLPVIQSGTAKFRMLQIESEWLDQVKTATGIRAKSNNVAGIGRNFWFNQYNIEQNLILFRSIVGDNTSRRNDSMKTIKWSCFILVLSGASLLVDSSASAGDKARHVVELFTSQSCYSCPPAEKLLGEVVSDYSDVIALEFHVDYWNDLVYGSAGQWQDPYSLPQYSKRQRDYRRLNLKGRNGVYTPQMVINGNYALVGSRASQLHRQLRADARMPLAVSVERTENGGVNVAIEGNNSESADIWLAIYDKKQVTRIPSGENKGKTLENFNVVRNFSSVGKWQGKTLQLSVDNVEIQDNQSCAVFVQKAEAGGQRVAGPILGAASC